MAQPTAKRLVVAVLTASALAVPAGTYAATGGSTSGGTVYATAPIDAAGTTKLAKSTGAATPTTVKRAVAIPKARTRQLGERTLRRGMSGADVKALQKLLRSIGLKISSDGSYGSKTYLAVRRFQKRAELLVTGKISLDDINRLRELAEDGGFDVPVVSAQSAATTPTGETAIVNPDGTATAPASAPPEVQQIIAAGNEIATKPYRYGGGHGKWTDSGYDCSGSVSYALHGAALIDVARDSTGFKTFGLAGAGQWVTVYAKASHAYIVVAGLRFDTSGRSTAGTRWQTEMRKSDGYTVRHPEGL